MKPSSRLKYFRNNFQYRDSQLKSINMVVFAGNECCMVAEFLRFELSFLAILKKIGFIKFINFHRLLNRLLRHI